MRANVYVLIATNHPTEIDQYMQRIAARKLAIAAAEEGYKSTFIDDADKKSFADYAALRTAFQATVDHIAALAKQNRDKEAFALAYGTMEKDVSALNTAIDGIVDIKIKAAAATSSAHAARSDSAALLMLIVLALALIFSILIGYCFRDPSPFPSGRPW